MLCERCHEREVTVHVTHSDGDAGTTTKHDFCESCASSSPVVDLALRYGPDVISEKLRVVGVSPERTRVRVVRTEPQAAPEEWSFLTSRLPPHYAVVGMEFGIICSPEELEQLKGAR
jgi:hypothetical protein